MDIDIEKYMPGGKEDLIPPGEGNAISRKKL